MQEELSSSRKQLHCSFVPYCIEDTPVLIVVTAYSNSVTTPRDYLPQPSVFRTHNNYKASCLAPCLNLSEVQAVTTI